MLVIYNGERVSLNLTIVDCKYLSSTCGARCLIRLNLTIVDCKLRKIEAACKKYNDVLISP